MVATLATPDEARASPPWADLVEVRLDLLGDDVGLDAVRRATVPVIATLRGVAQGGAFGGSPAEAARRLLAAARAGASWLDVEEHVVEHVRDAAGRGTARLLGSTHAAAPSLPPRGVDAWKVARPVTDAATFSAALAEARALAAAAARGEVPASVVVPYGPLASALRVVTAAAAEEAGGDPLVFAAATLRHEGHLPDALQGQIDGTTLEDDLRLREVTSRARLFGLLGRPSSRSPSPAMHNDVFRMRGVDALYLPAVDLPAGEAFRLPVEGWSVTTPRKEEAAALCQELDPLARACGAVNTVLVDATGLPRGWNTDASALLDALGGRRLALGEAWILGGGGYARAASVALARRGLRVTLVGGERARRAAQATGAAHAPPGTLPPRGASVLVNATPLGADGRVDPTLGAWGERVGADSLVVDAPYAEGPQPAAFARLVRAKTSAVLDGADLLRRQALAQAEIFAGAAIPGGPAWRLASDLPTVALVGLRGAGKTTVGRRLARHLGRPFVDTDEEIARRTGKAAGRVLAEEGEAAFRRVERGVALRALARRRVVVALGGGAVTSPDVEGALARAFVVHLRVAPAESVRRTGVDATLRPRLTDAPDAEAEAATLSRERGTAWGRVASVAVETDGRAPDAVVLEVLRRVVEGTGEDGNRGLSPPVFT